MERTRNTVAIRSTRMTTSPIGEALPNSSPLSAGGSGFCARTSATVYPTGPAPRSTTTVTTPCAPV